jgi:thiol-disulfide isomerase/thioredoxin
MRHLITLILMAGTLACSLSEAEDLAGKENYKARWQATLKVFQTKPVDLAACEKITRALIKDFPTRPNGYCDMMMLIEYYEQADRSKARELANEMISESVPAQFRVWAKGCLNRLDTSGKSVAIQFVSVDGREVDTAKMKGKVLLVDFWATTCSPCVAELPRVKAAYDKYHAQGFEVVGVSCDTDEDAVKKFLKRRDIVWPQYYDGKQQINNKLAQEFGIDGIPHIFLIDKKGCLRFDNIRASGAKVDFEGKIESLLAE